jgi:hypothetical protein
MLLREFHFYWLKKKAKMAFSRYIHKTHRQTSFQLNRVVQEEFIYLLNDQCRKVKVYRESQHEMHESEGYTRQAVAKSQTVYHM